MPNGAAQFAESWAAENVYVEAYDPPASVIDEHVERLIAAAEEQGISRDQLEDDVGDLHGFMAEQFESATDAEVERLASKDD